MRNFFKDLVVLPKSLVHLRKAPINAEMNIPQPRFLLRNPKDKRPTLISCHIRFNNDRIIFSTGEKIIPFEWDSSKQRAINSKKYPQNSKLNEWLDKIDADIKSVFREFNLQNVSPTPEMIKGKINERLFNKISKRITSLLDFIESYIQECSKIKNPNTIKTYQTTFNHFQAYSKQIKHKIDFDDTQYHRNLQCSAI